MTDERIERIGRNEALYRHVNERIEDVTRVGGPAIEGLEIVCECGDLACTETLVVPYEAYERARADPTRFIVKPRHVDPELASIVEHGAEYSVAEKRPAEAKRIAEETDPRS
jgi:hypothetical protein